MVQEEPIREGLTPKFGVIPNDWSRPVLRLALPEVALTTPPPAVNYFDDLRVALGMLGNDQVGDCVAAAIAHDYMVSWAACNPGATPRIVPTTADVLAFYWGINTDHVDRGLVVQTALGYLLKNGIAGQKPLAYALIGHDPATLRAATAFFASAIVACEVDRAQEYPARLWDVVPGSPQVGGHGVQTGSYTTNPNRLGIGTWGYVAQMTDAFINAKVWEAWLVIWPWVYDALPSETAEKLAADYKALTGRDLPSQVLPAPAPTPYSPRSAMATTFITPGRVLDTRTLNRPLLAGEDRKVQITGAKGIPAGAAGVSGTITVAGPVRSGWLAVTPTRFVGPSSTTNFNPGEARGVGFECGLASDGSLMIHNGSGGQVHVIVDITSYSA